MPEIRCKKCKHELKEIAFFCPVCGASPYDLEVKTSQAAYSPFMDNVVLSEGKNIERIAWEKENNLPANAEKKVRLFNIEFAGDNNGNINVYAINPVNTAQATPYRNPIPSGLASISYLVLAPVYLYIFGQGQVKRVNYLSWLYKEEANVENIDAYHDAGLATSPSIFFYKNIPYLVYLTGPTQITLLPAVKKKINANGKKNINFPDNIVSFCGHRENLYVVLNNAYYRVDVEKQSPEKQEDIPKTKVPQYCFVDKAGVNIR